MHRVPAMRVLGYVAALHLVVFALGYTYGLVMALRRRYMRPPGVIERLPVTIMKPLRGLEPTLEACLESFALLEGEIEVLLLVDEEDDTAAALAHAFTRRYPNRFRLIVGTLRGMSNPKIASLAFALPFARHPFLWMCDSTVIAEQAHLDALMGTWETAQQNGRVPTLVHSPIAAVGGEGLGARLERIHLSAYNNGNHEVALLVGLHAVVGKSLFLHRADLAAIGGLHTFGNVGGEDFQMGLAFSRVGVVRCSPVSVKQVLPSVGFTEWFARHARWAVVRRAQTMPHYLLSEHFTYLGVSMLFAAVGVLPAWVVGVALLGKMLGDAIFYRAFAGGWPALLDIASVPVKEVVLLLVWAQGFVRREVIWRGRQLRVGKQSIYSEVL